MGCDLCHLLFESLDSVVNGTTTNSRGAAAIGAASLWRRVSVTMEYHDVLDGNAKLLGNDLSKGCLFALTMWRGASVDHDGATLLNAYTRALIETYRSESFGTNAAHFNVGGEANTHELAFGTFLFLLGTQALVVHDLQCFIQSTFVVTGIIDGSGSGLVRELFWFDEVDTTYISRVLAQFMRHQVYSPLCNISCFGATSSTIGIGWSFIGEDDIATNVDGWDVVR